MTAAAIQEEAIIPSDMVGWRLDRALAALLPVYSRERLKNLISAGQVVSNGQLVRDPALKVKADTSYQISVPAPAPAHNVAQDIPLHILFEDDHLLVVDKPAGMVVHPAAGNLDGTMVNALLHHCAGRLSGIGGVARPGIVHRIDKDTSGLLVVANLPITASTGAMPRLWPDCPKQDPDRWTQILRDLPMTGKRLRLSGRARASAR
jgi:23S rRNA pseudouridine1911/1915/1917 synthase